MYRLIKTTITGFLEDDAFTHGAAVAFYSALSLSPILLVLVYLAGFLGPDSQAAIVTQLERHIGAQGGAAIDAILQSSTHDQSARSVAGTLGLIVIAFSATGVFAQLQYALNNLWNVKADTKAPIGSWIRKRLLSLGMIITLGFLLLTSMAASAVLSAALKYLQTYLPGTNMWLGVADVGLSLVIFTHLFAFMYKVLPDVTIAWRDVWVGSFATAVLFVLGKWLIALYLGTSTFASSYGAAGSLVVLLVWIYYSSLIVFFGAELTQSWAAMHGRRIIPNANAVWKDTEGKEVRDGEEIVEAKEDDSK